jgi:hypothetical protein
MPGCTYMPIFRVRRLRGRSDITVSGAAVVSNTFIVLCALWWELEDCLDLHYDDGSCVAYTLQGPILLCRLSTASAEATATRAGGGMGFFGIRQGWRPLWDALRIPLNHETYM